MMPRPFVIPQAMGHAARSRHARHVAFVGRVQSRPVSAAILAGTEGCMWCSLDPRNPLAKWCGKPRDVGRVYCAQHVRRAYDVLND